MFLSLRTYTSVIFHKFGDSAKLMHISLVDILHRYRKMASFLSGTLWQTGAAV